MYCCLPVSMASSAYMAYVLSSHATVHLYEWVVVWFSTLSLVYAASALARYVASPVAL